MHNAIKYNQNQPIRVQINISKTSNSNVTYIKIEFKDNGIGIIDSNKESIFRKGNKKDHHVRGMGVGLSLVKKVIESYDGKIWVENRVNNDNSQGSNFIVEIPEAN